MMWFPSVILSLWMVLKMRNSIRWLCLEDNTEQSESNLGKSLGIYNWGEESCLEDSTTLLCSFACGSVRTRSKSSRITPMRRILSFHGFNFVLLLGIGFTTDCICAFTALDNLQQEIIRDNHCARQAQRNPARHNKNLWKNKSVASGLSVIDFEYGERAKGEWAFFF